MNKLGLSCAMLSLASAKFHTSLSLDQLKLATNYRVSTKTVYTFVFRISWLPRGVEISSWTFFNSPFRVDFKISNFLLFGEIWTKILAKYYRENILKVNIFCLLFNEAVQHS